MSTTEETLLAALKEEHEQLHVLQLQLETARRDYLASDTSNAKWHQVRTALRDLADHLDRHFSFEEQDGFLLMVVRKRPSLTRIVEELRSEHDDLRERLNELTGHCEMIQRVVDRRETVGPRLQALLDDLSRHEDKEHAVAQETFTATELDAS